MREHPNAAIVRQFYEALARAHRGDVQHLLAASCSLSVDGGHHLAGTFEGNRGVADWFFRAGQFSISGLSLTPLTIAAIGSLAVAVEHVYATSDDAVLSVDSLRVFDIAQGRIERIRAIDLDAPAVARFWATACPQISTAS